MVDHPTSVYPYSPDGRIAVAPTADWLDPLVGLGYLAAVTRRIRLATGVLLLAEHNPVVVAKQAASLDVLSHGRLALGVGIGWSAEEYQALGVPFARRIARTAEYVEVLRTVWSEDLITHRGEFVDVTDIRVYPKPVRPRGSRSSWAGTATPPCVGWPATGTAGTASTSRWPRSANGSPPCGAGGRERPSRRRSRRRGGGDRCPTPGRRRAGGHRRRPSWCWWPRRPPTRRRAAAGCARWPSAGTVVPVPEAGDR